MKSLNIKKPKYILPAIVLPFAFIFNYLYLDMTKEKPKSAQEVALTEVAGLNTDLPTANLHKRETKDKFGAVQEAYRHRSDYSAIRELDEEQVAEQQFESNYTAEERRMLDSLNNDILTNKPAPGFMERVQQRQGTDRNRYAGTSGAAAATTRTASRTTASRTTATRTSRASAKPETEYEKEMRLFKEQMNYLDSLAKAGGEPPADTRTAIEQGYAQAAQMARAGKPEPQAAEPQPEPEAVRKTANPNTSYFNTVTDNSKEQFIKAILDEGLKVRDGGRIRIRLLDDVYVTDLEIEKGSYLYGIVTGFSAQRVEITISSILQGDRIIPVNLSIYDADGLKGLYVPQSQFRDLSKELAASAGQGQTINFGDSPESSTQMFYSMMDKMARTASSAASSSIRKNKATLKYNTVVYLIDNKAKNK